jgi:hypothetical protein
MQDQDTGWGLGSGQLIGAGVGTGGRCEKPTGPESCNLGERIGALFSLPPGSGRLRCWTDKNGSAPNTWLK